MSSSRSSGLPPKIETMVSLKVDNLTYRTTPEELRRVFQKYGDVGDVYIPRDRNSRTSRGFAFVRFYERRDAEDAMEAMDGKRLDGRELRVQLAKYGRPSPPRSGYKPSRRRSRSRSRSRNRSGGGGGGGRYRDERRRSSPSPKKRRSRSRSRDRSPRASRGDRNGGSVSPVKNNRSASPVSSRGSRSPVVAPRREPRAVGKRRDSDGNDFGDAARVSRSRSRSRSASRSRSRSGSRSS